MSSTIDDCFICKTPIKWYDNTPLAGEYTYRNKETLMMVDRAGKVRYFFFIKGRLWKIIDVLSVGEKSSWGKSFDEAVIKLVKHYGVAGRVLDAHHAAAEIQPLFVHVQHDRLHAGELHEL